MNHTNLAAKIRNIGNLYKWDNKIAFSVDNKKENVSGSTKYIV